eukprot:CAMPEP_0116990572 /NCGR_PEP_ID=MMETSP0467-20121206/65566_1 /TAXON_ID=283647 /ORGANISM="Mesodinium pulex, Strain SPMC105" /LENGTH=136 /DNA_ID=CAMNT_0004687377 /DNA_START=741 /DNA_END=1151 /DNA_ORIENTATION=-
MLLGLRSQCAMPMSWKYLTPSRICFSHVVEGVVFVVLVADGSVRLLEDEADILEGGVVKHVLAGNDVGVVAQREESDFLLDQNVGLDHRVAHAHLVLHGVARDHFARLDLVVVLVHDFDHAPLGAFSNQYVFVRQI